MREEIAGAPFSTMTPIERVVLALRPLLGEKISNRIRGNLPSRKPQLWRRLPQAVFKRMRLHQRATASTANDPVLVSLPEFGVTMELTMESRAKDLALYQYGIYEISGTRFVQSILSPGMIFVDVGANAGYYTLIAARLVGTSGHVYSFEPIMGPFDRLRRNVTLNGFRNVTLKQAAISTKTGRTSIYPSAMRDNDGLGSLHAGPERQQVGVDTEILSLDDFLLAVPGSPPDLIKVDVEGAEEEVFEGARGVLSRQNGPALLFESFSVSPICEMLTKAGYEVRRVHYSLAKGLSFPHVGEAFDDSFSEYEPPNYVALRSGGLRTFEEISLVSKRHVGMLFQFLAALA